MSSSSSDEAQRCNQQAATRVDSGLGDGATIAVHEPPEEHGDPEHSEPEHSEPERIRTRSSQPPDAPGHRSAALVAKPPAHHNSWPPAATDEGAALEPAKAGFAREHVALSTRARTTRPPIRKRHWVLGLAIGAVLASSLVAALPLYLLSRAERRANACFQRVEQGTLWTPGRCRPARYELFLAQSLPWLETEAMQLQVDTAYRAATLSYDLATASRPNASARSEAAAKLLQLSRGVLEPTGGANALHALPGAFEELIEHGRAAATKSSRNRAFEAARAIADLDSLKELAAGGDPSDDHGLNLQRGATLCLLGDTPAGLKTLLAADQAHRRRSKHADGLSQARLAMVACGFAGSIREIEPRQVHKSYLPALAALEASFGTVEGIGRVRELLEDPARQVAGTARLRLAAFPIAEASPTAAHTLALLAPRHGPAAALDLDQLRTPWMLLDAAPPIRALLVDRELTRKAAQRLQELAPDLPDESLTCAGDECPHASALLKPRTRLLTAARMMWLEVAAEEARAGRNALALDAAKQAAVGSHAIDRHELATVHLAAGDAPGALELLAEPARQVTRLGAAAELRVMLNTSLALAHEGRFEEAYAAATTSYLASQGAARGIRGLGDPEHAPQITLAAERDAAAWMAAAMALKIGKAQEVAYRIDAASGPETKTLATWLALVLADEAARQGQRRGLEQPSQTSASALPAIMFVVSQAVTNQDDREVWLDRIFDPAHRRRPLVAMQARAETARWNGDTASAQLWSQRSAKIQALNVDYRSALLAHLAELR